MGIFVSLLVLSFLVFFHELGHFLFARLFGVKVEVFSVGFGKRIFWKQVGETEYRLSTIPLGGYVKMKGQDDLDPLQRSGDNDSYNSKAPWQRILILLGGPLFNILLAFFLFTLSHLIGYETLSTKIGSLQDGMPSQKAGLQAGDRVTEINGIRVETWKEMSKVIKESESHLLMVIERGGEVHHIDVTPKIVEGENIFGETVSRRMVGIASAGELIEVQNGLWKSISNGIDETIDSTKLIYQSVEKLITGILSIDQLGGVVSVVDFTAKASESGFTTLLIFTALLSVNLGVLNLLPIPALDGGHIVFNIYEIVTGRIPNENVMYTLTVVGWVILFGLMGIGLFNDINRLVAG